MTQRRTPFKTTSTRTRMSRRSSRHETIHALCGWSYQFSDAVEAYGEFLANRRETYQNGWRQFWTFGVHRNDFYGNPFDLGQGWTG